MRHAVAEVFNRRGNGGCGVTVFVRVGQFLVRRLFDYCFHIKAVRRRLSAPNRGIVQETSPANLPSAVVGLGEGLRHSIENIIVSESSSPRKRKWAAIITDALFRGWGAVFVPYSGDVKIAGGKWKKPFFIMQAEACAVRLALSAFPAVLPSTMDVWVDNTSLQGAANKGNSKSHAMMWELQRIYEFVDSRGIQVSVAYVRSAENPADGISRGCVFTLQDLAKGGTCEGQRRCLLAAGPQSLPLRNKLYIHPIRVE
ncbi:hypothetical protein TCDM_13534 [Trypanosoma cruzi Dm28c]|uniref:Target of rapamycin (TOR) kinase 1 n=1 Tax=Trypanosoma cruzi Dm28c TaxID=1416333 RepID=V5AIG2_TRYCR|nr:hypothetical protein TCDM_13534 [Trypanosoma cruzi Dm28c]